MRDKQNNNTVILVIGLIVPLLAPMTFFSAIALGTSAVAGLLIVNMTAVAVSLRVPRTARTGIVILLSTGIATALGLTMNIFLPESGTINFSLLPLLLASGALTITIRQLPGNKNIVRALISSLGIGAAFSIIICLAVFLRSGMSSVITQGPPAIGTWYFCVALAAILIERLVLDRVLGATPLSDSSTRLSRSIIGPALVFVLLTVSAAAAWAGNAFILNKIGASYCFPLMIVALILVLAFGADQLLSRWKPFELVSRLTARAAVTSSLLAVTLIAGSQAPDLKFAATGAAAGGAYLFTALLYKGVLEKIRLAGAAVSASQEILSAGLLALVLAGIAGLHLFG
ncbi:MAG: hypothetical protein MUF22_03855 [Chitinispirillaceae bacterium]|jgi:Na+-translocating ferredoxin:NAD+ oxidoreductase RnfA subunit|nr:hypothetical protein [Chitinispirillaceae bacterium]